MLCRSIQKYCQDYGKFEDGNQLSFFQFQEYISETFPKQGIYLEECIIPQIKKLVKKTFLATKKLLNANNRKYSFEIFGYDFIIDKDFNVWLIEVNTNPCLEESSKLLKTLLPRMIDDAFNLTIDTIFLDLQKHSTCNKNVYPDRKSVV